MSHNSSRAVILVSAILTGLLVNGCTPEQWVIQRAGKGEFHKGYKYIGVSVDRSSVRVRGWNNDSVAIGVHMLADNRRGYSFIVDSLDDTLLLIGSYTGDANRLGQRPEAILDVPENADIFIIAGGSVHVDGVSGPIRIGATDTVSVSSSPRGPLTVGSSFGMVSLELPAAINADVDWESGAGSGVQFESDAFKGTRQRGLARGTLGKGGIKIAAKGTKGVEVQFR